MCVKRIMKTTAGNRGFWNKLTSRLRSSFQKSEKLTPLHWKHECRTREQLYQVGQCSASRKGKTVILSPWSSIDHHLTLPHLHLSLPLVSSASSLNSIKPVVTYHHQSADSAAGTCNTDLPSCPGCWKGLSLRFNLHWLFHTVAHCTLMMARNCKRWGKMAVSVHPGCMIEYSSLPHPAAGLHFRWKFLIK